MSKQLDVPYIAIIPYHVQTCTSISDAAKIYYGQITGLAQKTGYIWATDEQLAEMKSTCIRNVQRWNRELELAGFIRRETKNYPKKLPDDSCIWEKRRKIFVNTAFERVTPTTAPPEEIPGEPDTPESVEAFEATARAEEIEEDSNNVCGTAKNVGSLEHDKFVGSLEHDKNGGIINTPSIDKSLKQQSPAGGVVVPPSLNSLNISAKLKVKITKNHSIEEIDLAVKRCLAWDGRPTDSVGIMTTLQRAADWQDKPEPGELQDVNTKYLDSIRNLDLTTISNTRITIGSNYIEFVSGQKVITFGTDLKDFKETVAGYLDYLTNLEKNKL